jgi:type III secretion protein J
MTKVLLPVSFLLVCVALCGCSERLHGSLTEREANEILAALAAQGLDANKEKESGRGNGTYEVRVAARELPRALALLHELGLPRESPPGLEKLLGEGGLIPSELEEEAKLVAVMQAELTETLRRIDGVIDARVHVALPRKPGVFESTPPMPRASVFLKTRGAPTYDVTAIRSLVAGGVRNLRAEDVEVVGIEATTTAAAARPSTVRVGPFEVVASSAVPLRATLTLCVISLFALTSALLAFVIRSRRNMRLESSH